MTKWMNYLPTTTFGHIPGLDIQYSYVLCLFWFFICYLFLMLSHYNRECYLYYYIWYYLCYLHLRFSLLPQTMAILFSMFLEHWKIKYRLTCAILTPAHPHSVCQLLALWILPPYWQLSSFHFQPFLIALFLLNLVYCTFFFLTPSGNLYLLTGKFIPLTFIVTTDTCLLLICYVFSFLCFLTAPFIFSFIFLPFWQSGCNLWLQSNILKPILLNLMNESLSTSSEEKINMLV